MFSYVSPYNARSRHIHNRRSRLIIRDRKTRSWLIFSDLNLRPRSQPSTSRLPSEDSPHRGLGPSGIAIFVPRAAWLAWGVKGESSQSARWVTSHSITSRGLTGNEAVRSQLTSRDFHFLTSFIYTPASKTCQDNTCHRKLSLCNGFIKRDHIWTYNLRSRLTHRDLVLKLARDLGLSRKMLFCFQSSLTL